MALEVNEAKTCLTEFMVCQKRAKIQGVPPELTVQEKFSKNSQIQYRDKHITDKNYTRLLGLNIQNNGSWDSHLSTGKRALLPACRKIIGMLTKIKASLSTKTRLKLVNALIISKMSYGICLWGNTSTNFVTRAQVTLNMAGRFITGCSKLTRITDIMKACSWLDVEGLTFTNSHVQNHPLGNTKIHE